MATHPGEVTFDYDKQEWLDARNKSVEPEDNWHFPCPRCQHPAEMTGYDAYNEHHECLVCHYKFNVN